MPITRKRGHLFINWGSWTVFFTKYELQKLHTHFYHPYSNKLFNVIKRSRTYQADQTTISLLKDISKHCATCQTYASPPERFKVSLTLNEITFNKDVPLDLSWLGCKALLHVVHTETHFSGAQFLRGHIVEDVSDEILIWLASIYTGFARKMKVDKGSWFTSIR